MPRFADNYAALISFDETDYFKYDRLKDLIHVFEKNVEGNQRQTAAFRNIFRVAGGSSSFFNDVSEYSELRRLFCDEFRNEVMHCNNFLIDRAFNIRLQIDFLHKALEPVPDDSSTSSTMSVHDVSAAPAAGGGGPEAHDFEGLQMRRVQISSPSVKLSRKTAAVAPFSANTVPASSSSDSSAPLSLALPVQVSAVIKPAPSAADAELLRRIKSKNKKMREGSLKRTISTCFESLQALENFRLLNYTACIKILKKFDKIHKPRSGDVPLHLSAMHVVHGVELGRGAELKNLVERIERLYAFTFCKGDLAEAVGKLRLMKGSEPPRQIALVSFKFGVFCCLLLWLVMDLLVRPKYDVNIWTSPSLHYLSFVGNVIVYRWFWGLSVFAWERASVNYQLLFGFADNHVPHYQTIFDDCTNLSIVYLLCFIFYLDALRDPSQALGGIVPANTFLVVMLATLVMRFGYSYFFSRQFYGVFSPRELWHMLTPLSRPSTLKDRFAADMACSLTRELTDLVYASCFVFSGAVGTALVATKMPPSCDANAMQIASALLNAWPQLVRFCQCLRRQFDSGSATGGIMQCPISYNTLKYSGAVLVITLGTFRQVNEASSAPYYAFVIVLCLAVTIYQAVYDIVVDWGLLKILPEPADCWGLLGGGRLPDKVFLRHRLMYHKPYIYYTVMVINPLLRFVWTLSLLPTSSQAGQIVSYLSPCLCTIELFRRFLWCCLKLEMDHIHNAEHMLGDDEGGSIQDARNRTAAYKPLQQDLQFISVGRRSGADSSSSDMLKHVAVANALRESVPYHIEGFVHGVQAEEGGSLHGPQGKKRLKNVLSLCGICTAAVSVIWIIALDISGGM